MKKDKTECMLARGGTRLIRLAGNCKDAGTSFHEIAIFFTLSNISSRTMALDFTQHLTETFMGVRLTT
jgi:hypothetical protein